MLLAPSITFYFHCYIWGCLCSTGPFQYRWLKGYIYISMLFSSSNRKYHHMLSFISLCSGKPGISFSCSCAVYDSANSRMRFALQIALVCLYSTPSHYHHCAKLSEDSELIKCLSDICCRVCKTKHILCYPFYNPLYNIWGCVFSVYPLLLWWLREYIYFVLLSSSNRKYELLPIV